jgi:hypothetical protein
MTPLPSQDAPVMPWPFAVQREAFEHFGTAGYLPTVLGLLDREKEALASEDMRTLYLDKLGTELAMIGEEQRATRRGDEAFASVERGPANAGQLEAFLASHHPVPALKAIVDKARNRQVVMINEEHRSSRQRALAHQLLGPLRDSGFTYLAVETISEDEAALAARGYPVLGTGTYTRDPVFGDLIRRALDLGYVVFGYDAGPEVMQPRPDDQSPLDAINRREHAQAVNIVKRVLARDPKARVLVYAGRDHIAESSNDDWKPMGGEFKTLTGIDPLSINQFSMTERSDPAYESWCFRAVDKAGWLADGPVLLTSKDGTWWSSIPEVLDANLFCPRTRLVNGRPDWMAMGGLRMPYEVEVEKRDEPVLIQALVAGESDDAIPLDHVVWWPGTPRPALMLRPGSYVIRVIDGDGHELDRRTVSID